MEDFWFPGPHNLTAVAWGHGEGVPDLGVVGLRVVFRTFKGFFRKITRERRWDRGLILLDFKGFFENNRKRHDLGRPPGRSDGRE